MDELTAEERTALEWCFAKAMETGRYEIRPETERRTASRLRTPVEWREVPVYAVYRDGARIGSEYSEDDAKAVVITLHDGDRIRALHEQGEQTEPE